jgi:hypothetical protein
MGREYHRWIRKILAGDAEKVKSLGKLRHRYWGNQNGYHLFRKGYYLLSYLGIWSNIILSLRY